MRLGESSLTQGITAGSPTPSIPPHTMHVRPCTFGCQVYQVMCLNNATAVSAPPPPPNHTYPPPHHPTTPPHQHQYKPFTLKQDLIKSAQNVADALSDTFEVRAPEFCTAMCHVASHQP